MEKAFLNENGVSTHSRLKAAAGGQAAVSPRLRVSTHSRLKAAAAALVQPSPKLVSTHSRLKAAAAPPAARIRKGFHASVSPSCGERLWDEYSTALVCFFRPVNLLIVKEQNAIANLRGFGCVPQVGDLYDEGVAEHVGGGFRAVVFYFAPPFAAQVVEAQAVGCGVVGGEQFGFQFHPLVGCDIAFEYGILYAHAVVEAVLCYAPQPRCTFGVLQRDVIGNQHQHGCSPLGSLKNGLGTRKGSLKNGLRGIQRIRNAFGVHHPCKHLT